MQLSITFRHMESSEDVKKYAEEKLQRLEKYVDSLLDVQVVMNQEKHRHQVEVHVKADELSITGREETSDAYSSIDAVVDNIERQMKKYKTKHKSKGKKTKGAEEERGRMFRMDVIAAEPVDDNPEPQVIVSENSFAKPMSLEEAVMQMTVTDIEFIVFTDSSSENINVLYRRKDGNFGLIQPEVV